MAATTETMAGTAPDANPVERLRQAFNRLGEQQKMIFLVGVAALIAVVVGSILWSRQPDWKVLFSNLNEKDGGAIVAILETQNTPHRYSDGGSLMVPAERVHEVRLKLASQGKLGRVRVDGKSKIRHQPVCRTSKLSTGP